MILPFPSHHGVKILIRPKVSPILFFFVIFLLLSSPISSFDSPTMKVHPQPKKRTLTNSALTLGESPKSQMGTSIHHYKKLRRLPHIFSRVLELPFNSEADVSVEETSDCFKFVAESDDLCGDEVRAEIVEIHPGIVKIVVREMKSDLAELLNLDELELDVWRFRLPAGTLPEMTTASCADGVLVVTVPKDGETEDEAKERRAGEVWGEMGRLVAVQ